MKADLEGIEKLEKDIQQYCDTQDGTYTALALCEVARQLARIATQLEKTKGAKR